MSYISKTLKGLACASALLVTTTIHAAPIVSWVDWKTSDTVNGVFVAKGVVISGDTEVDVTYTNAQGVAFYQADGGTNYWAANSPVYTSSQVANAPETSDLIALNKAGSQTLTFSRTVSNLIFSFVSLNNNGYGFVNQDFDILSYGLGYWGSGSVSKQVTDLTGGDKRYDLIGSGEPHGTIMLTGSFDSITWSSLSDEHWNGFTIGIHSVAPEPSEVPTPATMGLLAAGVMGLFVARRRVRS